MRGTSSTPSSANRASSKIGRQKKIGRRLFRAARSLSTDVKAALGGAGRRVLAHPGIVVVHQVAGALAGRTPVVVDLGHRRTLHSGQIGRATCRESECQ